ncbi:hypothetical protein BDV19DRAFT_385596 [Aspergillus venezuelensis]
MSGVWSTTDIMADDYATIVALNRLAVPDGKYCEEIRVLLSDATIRNHEFDEDHFYLFYVVLEQGDVKSAEMLLREFGVDPNVRDGNQRPLLDYAIHHPKVVQLLLDHEGSRSDNKDCFDTALSCNLPSLNLLLQYEVTDSIVVWQQELILKAFAQVGDESTTGRLLPCFNDEFARYDQTSWAVALDGAVIGGHDNLVAFLLRRTTK